MVNLIKIVFLFLGLLVSLSIQSQQTKSEIFNQINLEYPGLGAVKKACKQNNFEKASKELLKYYRNRVGINHPEIDLKKLTISEKEKQIADEALSNIFYAHEGYQPSFYYGKDINWRYWPIKDGELRLQLHRHGWFTPMGKAYRLSGDEKYVKAWMYQYRDWIKKNPLVTLSHEEYLVANSKIKDDIDNMSYAWRPLEVGSRLQDQIIQFILFNKASSFTPDFLIEMLDNYHRQANYLIEHYSSAGNHLLFEAQHLYFASTFFPEFKDAARWRKSSVDVLTSEIHKQIYNDGGQFELDPLYHLASIEIFCKALRMAYENQRYDDFSQEYKDIIEKMIVFYYNINYPDYTNPCFSDAKRREKEVKLPNYKLWTKIFPSNEQIRYFATEGKDGQLPKNLSKGFCESGFFTFRNGWKKDATVMVLKAGPKGEWHNQPDNGTFELWFNGVNLFPDTGFYIYGGDENVWKQRNWFRQTMVHNTLTLDNKNLEKQESVTKLWKPEGKTPVLVTENQSYKNLKHRRSVFFVDQKYFVIVDEAIGNAHGKVGLHFQVKEGAVDVNSKDLILTSGYSGDSNFKLQCFPAQNVALEKEEGWQSTHYLQREKRLAVSFDAEKSTDLPIRYITIVYPVENCSKAPSFSAYFLNKSYDDKDLKIEVSLGGMKKTLEYKL